MSPAWLEILKEAVREAGLALRRHLQSGRRPTARRKADGGWVTDFDIMTEELIIDRLRRYFPDHGVLGEESGLNGDGENCWVIDPLDGTTNFIHGYPQCAVSAAFCYRGRAELGVVYDIATDELFSASSGGGAHLNDSRIRVSDEREFRRALLIVGGKVDSDMLPHFAELSSRCDGMRRLGATTLELAWVAAGRAEALISGGVNYWDVAAGALLVREAGGLLSDINDKTEFVFNEKTSPYVAASPRLFAKIFTETKLCYAARKASLADAEE